MQDVYFDDDSAEVVISSRQLGDDHQGSLFTNSNWFTFRDESIGDTSASAALSDKMDEINLNDSTHSGGNSSSDDEVVVGEDEELVKTKDHSDAPSGSDHNATKQGLNSSIEKMMVDSEVNPVQIETPVEKENQFGDRTGSADWARFEEPLDSEVGGSSPNPFISSSSTETVQPGGSCSDVNPKNFDYSMHAFFPLPRAMKHLLRFRILARPLQLHYLKRMLSLWEWNQKVPRRPWNRLLRRE